MKYDGVIKTFYRKQMFTSMFESMTKNEYRKNNGILKNPVIQFS